MAEERAPLVEMKNIFVSFGGVHAVENVTIDLFAGEVVGLVGGNGAGKSTLMKVLSGAQKRRFRRGPDRRQAGDDHQSARRQGARHRDDLPDAGARRQRRRAGANLFLGRELMTGWGTLDDVAMEAATRKVMGRLNPNFKRFKNPVITLSGGQRQSVAIARAIHFNARILIMDEPTAALGPAEARAGPLARPPAEEGRHRHLPDQPRNPRRLRSRRPHQRDEERPPGRHRRQGGDVTVDEVLAMIIAGNDSPPCQPIREKSETVGRSVRKRRDHRGPSRHCLFARMKR